MKNAKSMACFIYFSLPTSYWFNKSALYFKITDSGNTLNNQGIHIFDFTSVFHKSVHEIISSSEPSEKIA